MGEAPRKALAGENGAIVLDTFGGRIHVEWDPAAAVTDTMTFIPEGAIPEPHQQAAINDVLPIVGSGASDATLLEPTPEKYQATVDRLVELGYLEGAPDVAATYDRSFYDAMGEIPAP